MRDAFSFETISGLRPVDLVRAAGVRHAFRRHLHRRGVICRIDAGVRRYALAGSEGLAAAGDVMVIPPGVPHACEPGRGQAYSYRVISCPGPFPAAPFVVRDGRVQAAFDRAFQRLLCGDAAGAEPLVQLLLRLSRSVSPPAVPRERARLEGARAMIERHHAERLPLRALAGAARMSPYSLHRAFRERYGLPPLEYQHLVRIQRAQDLLREDPTRPLSALALDLGFADQAHFTRRFKQYVGMPPRRWRAASAARPPLTASSRTPGPSRPAPRSGHCPEGSRPPSRARPTPRS